MNDYFLRFNSEEEAQLILEPFLEYGSVDYIGAISKPTGIIEPRLTEMGLLFDNEQITVPGYHVNFRSIRGEIPEFDAYKVTPNTPARTWL